MSHNLFRLLDSIANTPHFVTQSALEPIVEYLQNRNTNPSFSLVPANPVERQAPEQLGTFGEILIDGPITYKPVMGMCGPSGTSYQGILEDAAELIASGVKTIVMVHSSPGGQALQCFATASEIRAMCDDADVTLISYIDEYSASASLALGIVADEVIIHPEATTGSIGCVMCLMDKSKALSNMGLKPVYIASTPGKTPFDAEGAYSTEFLAQVQEDVTRLGTLFAEHVATYSGIPVEDVLAMDAKMFHAQAALEVGLVNKIMDHREFSDYLSNLDNGN